jgi:hypothetical protein
MKLRNLLVATVSAAVLLCALGSVASARNFSVSSQSQRAVFETVEFHFPSSTTRCQLTLESSFHSRTMVKTSGSLVGYVTSATLGPCATGTATILRESLPWHIRYSGFQGTLPRITSQIFHILSASWRIREAGGIACLARSSATEPLIQRVHVDGSGHETVELEGSIRTGVECFGLSGSVTSDLAPICVPNTETKIAVTLI